MEKKASVFRKLTALFLATELLVLLGTGLLLLRCARTQEQGLREESVPQSVQLLEEQLQGAYQVAESLTGDSRLSRIAYHMYPNGYERSQMVLGILENIRNTCSLNPAIEDIRVHFPSENLELSDSEGYNNNGCYSLSKSTPIGENLFWEDGRLRMKIAHPLISRFMGEDPDYECEVVFSKIYTDTILSVFGDGGEQGAVAILNNLGGEVETVFGEARDTEILAAIAGQFGGEAPGNAVCN